MYPYPRPYPYVSAWGPVAVPARGYVGAATPAVVEYGEKSENIAATLYPTLAPYLELRDKIFSVADDLGIGDEVRVLYYSLATGQRLTSALSQVAAATPIVSGSAILSIAGTISSIASLVGIVVGIFSLFSDDDEGEPVRRKTEQILARMSIDDFAAEQDAIGTAQASALFKTPNLQAAQAAQKLAGFFRQLKTQLSEGELALFVSLSNIGRWEGYMAGWNRMKQSQRDAIRQYAPGFAERLALNIASEQVTAKKIAQGLTDKGASLARIAPPRRTHWVMWLGLLAGASALAWFFVPGFQPVSVRLLSAARGQLHKVPYISKVV